MECHFKRTNERTFECRSFVSAPMTTDWCTGTHTSHTRSIVRQRWERCTGAKSIDFKIPSKLRLYSLSNERNEVIWMPQIQMHFNTYLMLKFGFHVVRRWWAALYCYAFMRCTQCAPSKRKIYNSSQKINTQRSISDLTQSIAECQSQPIRFDLSKQKSWMRCQEWWREKERSRMKNA